MWNTAIRRCRSILLFTHSTCCTGNNGGEVEGKCQCRRKFHSRTGRGNGRKHFEWTSFRLASKSTSSTRFDGFTLAVKPTRGEPLARAICVSGSLFSFYVHQVRRLHFINEFSAPRNTRACAASQNTKFKDQFGRNAPSNSEIVLAPRVASTRDIALIFMLVDSINASQ